MSAEPGKEGSAERDRWQAERERWRAEREAERETRHAEREARRQERSARRHMHMSAHGMNFGIDPDEIARSISAAFTTFDDEAGETHEETVERQFTVDGTARLRVRNISGETAVRVGEPGIVRVIARKKVRGASDDRAKRLLENVEVRIEQQGNVIRVEPHLYEQERGWLDLFRGRRFRVDFEITVPKDCAIEAQTVSGDLSVAGTRGPLELGTVSGEVEIANVQGPLRLKTVSGDIDCRDYIGHIEGNSVSGDVTIRPAHVRSIRFQSVSGDIAIEGELAPDHEHRLKTISGDIELALAVPSATIEFRTNSGDVEVDSAARVVREGRKDRTIVLGDGRARVSVKSVSGDLHVTTSSVAGPDAKREPEHEDEHVWEREAEYDADAQPRTGSPRGDIGPDPERTEPMPSARAAAVRELLERVARGEVGVDEAAAQLDATRR